MKYTILLHIFFHYTRIMEKDLCRGLYTSLFCVIIPTLFPYFLRFWYPYILLHFKYFLLLVEFRVPANRVTCLQNVAKCSSLPYTPTHHTVCIHTTRFEVAAQVSWSSHSNAHPPIPGHTTCCSACYVYNVICTVLPQYYGAC